MFKHIIMGGIICLAPALGWAITIGAGPEIGVDKRGTHWYQEFQDWDQADVRALDANDDEYRFNDGNDTSRDAIAFYTHDDGTNLYFRLDFFDLGYGVENSALDVYVGIDCAPGGQPWFPDWTDTRTDHPWELCVKLYATPYYDLVDAGWTSRASDFVGSYWRSDLDGVEFGIKRSALIAAGWNGSSVINFQPFICRDGTHDGPGELTNRSDIVDHFGILTPNVGDGTGILSNAIPATAATGRAKYAAVAHANQSVGAQDGTQRHIFTDRADLNLYPGFVRLLDSAEMLNTPINLHLSGTLLISLLWARQDPTATNYPVRDGPTFLARVGAFVTNGPGALIGGVLAEHIMPYFEGAVNQQSIRQNSELIAELYGLSERDMGVMHTPERVIRSQTNNAHARAEGPLDGKTFEDIAASGFSATYLDEVTHLHWWFYPNETNNPGWDDYNCGRWAGGQGNDEETYHHKVHKINGVYCFMINDREDQAKFGNADGGMALDTRYTLLQKARHADSSQLTLVFDDWEAYAGNSFASAIPNNNADQWHATLRWAANHPWIELVTLKRVLDWATHDASWVIDHGYVYDQSSQTYEWLKRASEHTYDNWYYGSAQEESFFNRTAAVHDAWAPAGMKKYGDLNTTNTLIRDAWDAIAQITATNLRELAEWSYSAMIYETAWHDEDANPDQYQSRNYQVTFNRNDACTVSYEDTTADNTSGWAVRLHGHVRDVGVLKEAAEWVTRVRSGAQGAATSVYAQDIDDDTLDEYVLCNNRVFACFERWGARLVKAFVYDPNLNGGDAIAVIGAPVANPAEESENEGADNNRCSAFKDRYSTGRTNLYIDLDFAWPTPPAAGSNYWRFVSGDGLMVKTVALDAGRDVLRAEYAAAPAVGTLYSRHGLGPNQMDLMRHGHGHLAKRFDTSFTGLTNARGGEAYVVLGRNAALVPTGIVNAGWEGRELPLVEQFETYNTATNFSVALAFSAASARDLDGDGLDNTNEMALGTNHELWDTDGDDIPDGYEVAHGLNALSAADRTQDQDGDRASNYDEYIANTDANSTSSCFRVLEVARAGGGVRVKTTTAPGRLFQILYTDGGGWRAFANPANKIGTWSETGMAESVFTFTDDFTSDTSGAAPTGGLRAYRVGVRIP